MLDGVKCITNILVGTGTNGCALSWMSSKIVTEICDGPEKTTAKT
jgi:hypothetical protein